MTSIIPISILHKTSVLIGTRYFNQEFRAGNMNFIQEWKVGYGYNVYVTYINDPKSFYVCLADLRELMLLIETPGTDPLPASTMKPGQRVVYKSKILKKFVRGEICYINIKGEHPKCSIYAIDYGCLDKSVSVRHIYPPDRSAEPQNQRPGLATHCQLHLCEPLGEVFSKEVINTMREVIENQYATINVISKVSDQLVVELCSGHVPRDVATMLALIGITTMTNGQCEVNRFTKSLASLRLTQTLKYKYKQLNVGDILYVRVQSGTSESGFYVADVNDFKMLRSAQPSFSQYVKGLHMKDEDFVPGRPCAVKLGNLNEYERARIKKVKPNSKAILELVDWGREIESNFSSIRSIDSEFYLRQPIIAIYCSTTEDQLWVSTLPTFFFKGFELGIKIMELGNNSDIPHKVNIYPVHMLKYMSGYKNGN